MNSPVYDFFCPICRFWARECLTGDHSPNCPLHTPNLLPLLKGLKKGIHRWAEDEDGVPEELWEDYQLLCGIVKQVEQGGGLSAL